MPTLKASLVTTQALRISADRCGAA